MNPVSAGCEFMNRGKFQKNILGSFYRGSGQKPAPDGRNPQTARLIFQNEIREDGVCLLVLLFLADGTYGILILRMKQGDFRKTYIGQFMGIADGCNADYGKNQKEKQP